MNKLVKKYAAMAFGSTLFWLSIMSARAQTFKPPTVLPTENVNIGGAAGKCIGLADLIRTGEIHTWHIACYIKYIAQTLIALGGTISVIMVMVGGYMYIIYGEEGKDKGKKTITHALIGLAISLLSWVIVDLALRFATE